MVRNRPGSNPGWLFVGEGQPGSLTRCRPAGPQSLLVVARAALAMAVSGRTSGLRLVALTSRVLRLSEQAPLSQALLPSRMPVLVWNLLPPSLT